MAKSSSHIFPKHIAQWVFSISCLLFSSTGSSELIVITVHESPLQSVSTDALKKRWMGETKLINQFRVDVVDLNEKNTIRSDFYHKILGVSNRQLKAYWAKQVFRGNGFPPRMLSNDDEVMEWISEKTNRLGYIDAQMLKPGFKVLFRAGQAPLI